MKTRMRKAHRTSIEKRPNVCVRQHKQKSIKEKHPLRYSPVLTVPVLTPVWTGEDKPIYRVGNYFYKNDRVFTETVLHRVNTLSSQCRPACPGFTTVKLTVIPVVYGGSR